jgi:preprotein translocase subunit SecD
MKRLILAVSLFLIASVLAGGKKEQEMVVSFHLQGSESDGPKISVPQEVAGQQVFFRMSPEISHNDIESFRPFPAEDGATYGVMFKLDRTGAQRLAAVTNANQGALMMARVNGRPLDVVKINDTVRDGLIVIWQGITTREIAMADAMMPRIGQTVDQWKKAKKK